jgi:hypothetical protein
MKRTIKGSIKTLIKGTIKYPSGPAHIPPEASNVVVTGTPKIGDTLTLEYDYFQAEEIPESGSTYQWYRNGLAIDGATATTYEVTENDLTAELSASVVPSDGIAFGTLVTSAAVAVINARVLMGKGSTNVLQMYDWDGSSWSTVGNTFALNFPIGPSSLSLTEAAVFSLTNTQLRKIVFNNPNWSTVGNPLTITGAGINEYTSALSSSLIAFVDGQLDEIRTYSFDGTDWSQVGSGTAISDYTSGNGLSAVSIAPDRIVLAFNGNTNVIVRMYELVSGTWTQVGSDLTLSAGLTAVTAMTASRIAVATTVSDTIRAYDWNGTTFVQVGNAFSAGVDLSNMSITALSQTDVALFDNGADTVRVFRFDGTNWSDVGTPLSIPGAASWHIACMTYTVLSGS